MKLLHFAVQNVHMCIDFQYIERVLPLPMLEKVPAAPLYLLGLMNLQGKSIPIIDLSLRLGLTREEPYSLNTQILLCSEKGTCVGFIIDQIFGLIDADEAALQMREEFAKNHSPYLGALPLESGIALLLNTSQIVPFSVSDNMKLAKP